MVPAIKPIKIEIDLQTFVKIINQKDNENCNLPRLNLPLVFLRYFIFPIATGIKVNPIVVITEPVTIGRGKD